MEYPIIVFMDDENTCRVLVPDFKNLTFMCSGLEEAFEKAKQEIENKIRNLNAQGKNIPPASTREQYVTRYLDAILVNQVTVDVMT
ncbi:MAG: type II toxin-antitoxin system HicB family antitoxin [Pseudomonadales bacterium]|nr:type II toxin-antitoxin system HicB family antitoxin [Pseudomonadales bacterium]